MYSACAHEQADERRQRRNAGVFQDITTELNWVRPGRHHCIHSSTSVHTCAADLPKLKTDGFISERLKEKEVRFGKSTQLDLSSQFQFVPAFSHGNVPVFPVSVFLRWESLGWQIMDFP